MRGSQFRKEKLLEGCGRGDYGGKDDEECFEGGRIDAMARCGGGESHPRP